MSHIRMLYNPIALQFGLSQDDYDVVCSALHGVFNESFKQLKLVALSFQRHGWRESEGF